MSRKLSYSSRYPFEPNLLYTTLIEHKFWEAAAEEFREFTPQSNLESFSSDDKGTHVILKQTLPHDFLPPIAQSVIKFDMIITRQDFIGPYSPDCTEGTFTASIPAGPGWLKGLQELFPTKTGSTIRKTAEVKVYIPFISGKLEQLILVNLVELAKAEAEFITTYIYHSLGLNPADYPESYGDRSIYYQPDRSLRKFF